MDFEPEIGRDKPSNPDLLLSDFETQIPSKRDFLNLHQGDYEGALVG